MRAHVEIIVCWMTNFAVNYSSCKKGMEYTLSPDDLTGFTPEDGFLRRLTRRNIILRSSLEEFCVVIFLRNNYCELRIPLLIKELTSLQKNREENKNIMSKTAST